MSLSDRELATVLAALRYWQRQSSKAVDAALLSPDHFEESCTPLTDREIDGLCERLNCAG